MSSVIIFNIIILNIISFHQLIIINLKSYFFLNFILQLFVTFNRTFFDLIKIRFSLNGCKFFLHSKPYKICFSHFGIFTNHESIVSASNKMWICKHVLIILINIINCNKFQRFLEIIQNQPFFILKLLELIVSFIFCYFINLQRKNFMYLR